MYETLSHFAQTWGLLLFVFAFLLALAYALSPANRGKFEKASRAPLEEGDDHVET
jgi:cytochrome c oxidase cbb3-type subunit 4